MTTAQQSRYFEGMVAGVNLCHPSVVLAADTTPYHLIVRDTDGEEVGRTTRLAVSGSRTAIFYWLAAVVEEAEAAQDTEEAPEEKTA